MNDRENSFNSDKSSPETENPLYLHEFGTELNTEYMQHYVEDAFHTAVHESGFTFLDSDRSRQCNAELYVISRLIDEGTYDDSPDTTIQIEDAIRLINEADRSYIEKMKALNSELRVASLLGEVSEEDIYVEKARMFVRIADDDRVQDDTKLFDVLNRALPGLKITPEDPKLVPFFQELKQHQLDIEANLSQRLNTALGYSEITSESAGPMYDFIAGLIIQMLADISDIHTSTDRLATDTEREKYVRNYVDYSILTDKQIDLLVTFVNNQY
jgi:hypothetical protein